MSWAGDQPVTPYREPAGLVPMPCVPAEPEGKRKARRPRPGCPDCLPDEPCPRHDYDVLASVPGSAPLSYEARMDKTFRAVTR